MAERLVMYVQRVDGTSYAEFDIRSDEPNARNIIDREAWHKLSHPRVVSVRVDIVQGRAGGYRQRSR